jgi:hypothetical protein
MAQRKLLPSYAPVAFDAQRRWSYDVGVVSPPYLISLAGRAEVAVKLMF